MPPPLFLLVIPPSPLPSVLCSSLWLPSSHLPRKPPGKHLPVPSALSTLLGMHTAPSLSSSTPLLSSPSQGGPLTLCFRSQPLAPPPTVRLLPGAPGMSGCSVLGFVDWNSPESSPDVGLLVCNHSHYLRCLKQYLAHRRSVFGD